MNQITLIEYDKLSERMSGRTTRIIDKCIQDLFNYGKVFVKDHIPARRSDNLLVYNKVIRRLRLEHPTVTLKYNQANQLIIIPFDDINKTFVNNYCSGKTTRIIDQCVQKLYKNGKVEVFDHHTDKHNETFEKVIRRLRTEHRHDLINYHPFTNVIELCQKK